MENSFLVAGGRFIKGDGKFCAILIYEFLEKFKISALQSWLVKNHYHVGISRIIP